MNKNLPDFLLHEYDNIAQAHFNATRLISEFYKHYISFIAIPISAIVIANSSLIDLPYVVIIVFSLLFSIAGVAVYCIIVKLRKDSLLYTQSVNGIRNYFFETSNISICLEARTRLLPKTISLPRKESQIYTDWVFFSCANSIYLIITATWGSETTIRTILCSLIFLIVSFLLHHFLYRGIKTNQELFKPYFGIDGNSLRESMLKTENALSEKLANAGIKCVVVNADDCPEKAIQLIKRKGMRFLLTDKKILAVRASRFCDLVFFLDYYSQDKLLPFKNIIAIKDVSEIYELLLCVSPGS